MAERTFMYSPDPSDQDCAQFTWRYEGAWLLLWSLCFIDDAGPVSGIADVPRLAGLLRDLGTDGVMARVKLRPQAKLLDAADLIYRRNWAVVAARLKGQDAPGGMDAGVVVERHYTLNWLIGYGGQAWDDISTDT